MSLVTMSNTKMSNNELSRKQVDMESVKKQIFNGFSWKFNNIFFTISKTKMPKSRKVKILKLKMDL